MNKKINPEVLHVKQLILDNLEHFLHDDINETLYEIKQFATEYKISKILKKTESNNVVYDRPIHENCNIEFDFNRPGINFENNMFEIYLKYNNTDSDNEILIEETDTLKDIFSKINFSSYNSLKKHIDKLSPDNILENKNHIKSVLLTHYVNKKSNKHDSIFIEQSNTDQDRRIGLIIEKFKNDNKYDSIYFNHFINECNKVIKIITC